MAEATGSSPVISTKKLVTLVLQAFLLRLNEVESSMSALYYAQGQSLKDQAQRIYLLYPGRSLYKADSLLYDLIMGF